MISHFTKHPNFPIIRFTTATNVSHIENALFKDVHTLDGDGGAICLNDGNKEKILFIEETAFIDCFCSKLGGAIYFGSSGQCVMYHVCGFRCRSTSGNYQFCYISATSRNIYRNDVYESSIRASIAPSSTGTYSYTMYHYQGTINIKSLNNTQNTIYNYAAIYCTPTYSDLDYSPYHCSLNFSSFSNNTARNAYCIYLYLGTQVINHCNIFYNEEGATTGTRGIIYSHADSTITDSCILKNNAKYILYVNGISNSITLVNCSTDFTESSISGVTKNVVFESTSEESFINRIQCFETVECYAEFDSIEGVPMRTISDTFYTSTNSKHHVLCNTPQHVNKKASLKQEAVDAVKYAVIICFLPSETSESFDN